MICILLQEDIVAVNQIFKDLGLLVHEQADVIGQFFYNDDDDDKHNYTFLPCHRVVTFEVALLLY